MLKHSFAHILNVRRNVAFGGPNLSSEELVIDERPETTKTLRQAQELFSLFILALTSQIKELIDITPVKLGSSDNTELWEHPVFKLVAEGVVRAKLAQDVEEAYTLIIPAFAEYNLLPAEPSQPEATASGDQAVSTRAVISETSAVQDPGVRHSPSPGVFSAFQKGSTPQQSSTQQVATLHQEPSREQGSPIHRHPSRQSQYSEPGAAQPSEETSAQPTQAVISRPSSVRRSSY